MTKHIVKTDKEWHSLRKKYITASVASALVGADPYMTPKAISSPEPFNGNAYTELGQLLEPTVLALTNKVLGTTFELYEGKKGHKEFYTAGHFGATPDAHMGRKVLLECKTANPKAYLKYSAVPPSKYLIQLIVQLMCTGLTDGYLAIMSTDLTQKTIFPNWPITIYKIELHLKIRDILNQEAERFRTSKTYRVNSKIKRQIGILLSTSYRRVAIGQSRN